MQYTQAIIKERGGGRWVQYFVKISSRISAEAAEAHQTFYFLLHLICSTFSPSMAITNYVQVLGQSENINEGALIVKVPRNGPSENAVEGCE